MNTPSRLRHLPLAVLISITAACSNNPTAPSVPAGDPAEFALRAFSVIPLRSEPSGSPAPAFEFNHRVANGPTKEVARIQY
jgi:hypothetical protein